MSISTKPLNANLAVSGAAIAHAAQGTRYLNMTGSFGQNPNVSVGSDGPYKEGDLLHISAAGGQEAFRLKADGEMIVKGRSVDIAKLQQIVEILLEHAPPEVKMAVDVLVEGR